MKWAEWREALGGRANIEKKEEEKEAAAEEEVDLLEVFFLLHSQISFTCYWHSRSRCRSSVVPVNFVPIIPITFVQASSSSSVSDPSSPVSL